MRNFDGLYGKQQLTLKLSFRYTNRYRIAYMSRRLKGPSRAPLKGPTRKAVKMSTDSTLGKQEEVDRNLAFFLDELPKIPATYIGKFALLRHQKIIDYYDTAPDAIHSANKIYPDGIFSIQQVINTAVNLGFYSYAVPLANTQ
jgi:hypothetical protein